MTIDPDIRGRTAHFGVPSGLIQAVNQAEGNLLKAVQCSIPAVQTREQAIDVTCRSATHAAFDFLASKGLLDDFVSFWGARWAPVGATNDPKGLNANWSTNVKKILGLVATLLLCAVSAPAQDCPVKHPALTSLDHASMLAAYTASFEGSYHRPPTMQPGSGPDDGEYWIHVADHYGEFSDGICRAGWSAYWETKLATLADAVAPSLGDLPARFLPQSAPPIVVPAPAPPAPLPSVDLTPLYTRLDILTAKVDALAVSEEAFHSEVRSAWKQVLTYAAPIIGAIFAGRATK